MEAIISGESGTALLVDYDLVRLIDVRNTESIPVTSQDVHYYLNGRSNLEFVEGLSVKEIRMRLFEAKTNCDTLRRCLTVLDATLPIELRRKVASMAEGNLGEARVFEYVRNVLCAAPFPIQADVKGALEICLNEAGSLFWKLLDDLCTLQPAIALAHSAWQIIPLTVFGSYEERQCFQSAAVREGLFRLLCTASADPNAASTFLVLSFRNPNISVFPFYKSAIRWWLATFQDLSEDKIEGSLEEKPGDNLSSFATEQRKSVILGELEYCDLSRVALSAAKQLREEEGPEHIFSTARYLSDPSFIANKKLTVVGAVRSAAFS